MSMFTSVRLYNNNIYKSYLIFKILPMLDENRILLMGNSVEMAGGDINFGKKYTLHDYFLVL